MTGVKSKIGFAAFAMFEYIRVLQEFGVGDSESVFLRSYQKAV